MAKKKRRRRYSRTRKRRYSKPKPPLELIIGAASIPFTPPASGWNSPVAELTAGNFEGVMQSLKKGFIAMERDGRVNLGGLINPFDFDQGRYMKILIWSGVAGMIRKKIVGRYTTPLFKKIPLIGRMVS